MRQRPFDLGPLAAGPENQGAERHCPDHALCQDLEWIDSADRFEIDGQEAPYQVGSETGYNAVASLRGRSLQRRYDRSLR